MALVTPSELRSVLGVSSSLYSDAYLTKIIDTSELVILPLLVSYSSAVTNRRIASNVATLLTNTPHNYIVGSSVVVAGVDATFNGTYTVTGVDGEYQFSYAKTNADINANAVIPGFMQTGGVYQPMKAVPTISNAMDVGDPSNFVRIMELMQQEFPRLQSCFSSVSISDEDTKATLLRVFKEKNYLMDPHGAVGFLALENYLYAHPAEKGIFLETAHPVKFLM